FHNKFMKSIEKNEKPNFKVTKDGGDIDAITAATITSRAFCDGINEAKKIYDENALKFITSAGGKS
ncbi:MAG: FMN-binding protein, partial [Candidatus Riflebacteria bacterium]|nr:FMN-binding protein [Candidatus Riflebacteria bacterium]